MPRTSISPARCSCLQNTPVFCVTGPLFQWTRKVFKTYAFHCSRYTIANIPPAWHHFYEPPEMRVSCVRGALWAHESAYCVCAVHFLQKATIFECEFHHFSWASINECFVCARCHFEPMNPHIACALCISFTKPPFLSSNFLWMSCSQPVRICSG